MYGGVEVQLHVFLTSAPNGDGHLQVLTILHPGKVPQNRSGHGGGEMYPRLSWESNLGLVPRQSLYRLSYTCG
jgi:hypothetical protein